MTIPCKLTPTEEKEILDFWRASPDMDSSEIVEIFEKKFGTTITEAYLTKIVVSQRMKDRGLPVSGEVVGFIASAVDEMTVTKKKGK
jgi:hypothetical protein